MFEKNCKQIATIVGLKGRHDSALRVYSPFACCPTLTTISGGGHHAKILEGEDMEKSKVRRLTPREYWRLMGFTDEDFEKAQAVNSDTQLYKQAGNSIVVQVLEGVLKNLLK